MPRSTPLGYLVEARPSASASGYVFDFDLTFVSNILQPISHLNTTPCPHPDARCEMAWRIVGVGYVGCL